jgi:hypothetical protein
MSQKKLLYPTWDIPKPLKNPGCNVIVHNINKSIAVSQIITRLPGKTKLI